MSASVERDTASPPPPRAAGVETLSGVGPASAVLLAAHGAGTGSSANRRVVELARRLGERLPGTRVRAAFTLGSPSYGAAAAEPRGQAGRALIVVPVFTSDGYFTRQRLPSAVGACELATSITQPVGTHPKVVAAVVTSALARLRRLAGGAEGPAGARRAEPIACLVIGHGTERAPRSGEATEALASSLRRAVAHAEIDVDVATAFFDQEPRLERVAAGLGAARCLTVPFLVGGGRHAALDVAARLERATTVHCTIAPGLLDDPALDAVLVDALIERVRAAAATVVEAGEAEVSWERPAPAARGRDTRRAS